MQTECNKSLSHYSCCPGTIAQWQLKLGKSWRLLMRLKIVTLVQICQFGPSHPTPCPPNIDPRDLWTPKTIEPLWTFYRTPVNLGSDLWVLVSLTEWVQEVCLKILTQCNRTIQCNWRSLVTNAHCATWWPILRLVQVAPPGGQIFNQCM